MRGPGSSNDKPRSVPILAYHSIDDSGSVVSIAPDDFQFQIENLKKRGYQGIAVRELETARRGELTSGIRPIAITFDDGFANLLDHAVPVLESAGFRATVFAVSKRLGKDNLWSGQLASVPTMPLASLSGLEEMVAAGIEIGSHTRSHPVLPRLGDAELQEEIVGSKADLEDALGVEVTSFAYPYGAFTPRERDSVASAYQLACGTSLGFSTPEEDRCALRRLDMYYLRTRPSFERFDSWRGRARLVLRRTARTIRGVLTRGSYFSSW